MHTDEPVSVSVEAIPAQGVRLSQAVSLLAEKLRDTPRENIALSKDWISTCFERAEQVNAGDADPDVVSRDTASLLLRDLLTDALLVAFVLHPKTGEWLQLVSRDWELAWDDPFFSLHGDFVYDRQSPRREYVFGPSGGLLDGKLRPIFLRTSDLEAFIVEVFERPIPKPATKPTAVLKKKGSMPATLKAIAQLAREMSLEEYPTEHVFSLTLQLLERKGFALPSKSTFYRAWDEFKRESN